MRRRVKLGDRPRRREGRDRVTIKRQAFKPKLNVQPTGKAPIEFPVNPSPAYSVEAAADFGDGQDLDDVLADGMGWLGIPEVVSHDL